MVEAYIRTINFLVSYLNEFNDDSTPDSSPSLPLSMLSTRRVTCVLLASDDVEVF